MEKPITRPSRAYFSSGPCAKIPQWDIQLLKSAFLGRSHRAEGGKARLKQAIDLTREVLEVPDNHLIAVVPASDTGAVEMALWSLLGPRPVDVLVWESFGEHWAHDIVQQLKLPDVTVYRADYGSLPDLHQTDFHHDVVFAWNGTTSGVRVPDSHWIAADREGLTICDATSAAFAQELDFSKLDVVTFSWQKVLGGEAAHGMIVLGPRAIERLISHEPSWPMPKIFRMTKDGALIDGLFRGETINTPSMLCVEDYIISLNWAKSYGGLRALRTRADKNTTIIQDWVDQRSWIENMALVPQTRSNTSVCLLLKDKAINPRAMAKLLETEGVAFDISGHISAPPSLRIWCGVTVESADLIKLLPWLDWAYAQF